MLARRATKGGLGPGYLHLLLDLDYLGPDVAIYTYFWKTKKNRRCTRTPPAQPPLHPATKTSPSPPVQRPCAPGSPPSSTESGSVNQDAVERAKALVALACVNSRELPPQLGQIPVPAHILFPVVARKFVARPKAPLCKCQLALKPAHTERPGLDRGTAAGVVVRRRLVDFLLIHFQLPIHHREPHRTSWRPARWRQSPAVAARARRGGGSRH